MTGKWISIDGSEGSGKTTLVNELKKQYPTCMFIPEFSNSIVGKTLSTAVKDEPYLISNSIIGASLLFLSDYFHMLETIIIPSLQEGKTVISDRGYLSKLAVQSAVMSEVYDNKTVRKVLLDLFSLSISPDYTIILDVPLYELKRRLINRDGKYDDEREKFIISTMKEIDYFSKLAPTSCIRIEDGSNISAIASLIDVSVRRN